MSTALRRALSIAPRAASRVTASPSSLASGARQTRNYAADPNAPPKVPYPWNDPMNPSNWKEEHVRDRPDETRRETRARDETRRDEIRARDRERGAPKTSSHPIDDSTTDLDACPRRAPRPRRSSSPFSAVGPWSSTAPRQPSRDAAFRVIVLPLTLCDDDRSRFGRHCAPRACARTVDAARPISVTSGPSRSRR